MDNAQDPLDCSTGFAQVDSPVRDAFEKHMLDRDKNVMLERDADGNYLSWFTDRYWATWIAAHEEATRAANEDLQRLNWLDKNIFHREMHDWDKSRRSDQLMWVLFAPKGAQGTARRIIDAARSPAAQ